MRTGREELTALRFAILGGDYCTAAGNSNPRVRYDAVNAMLLNEFLKEHDKVQNLEATITDLKSIVEKQEAANAQQQKQIEGLTAGLQKATDQLKLSKRAPHAVADNQ